ncbi:MAG: hypothetical protein RIC30_17470 [Marinoscillum sp.]|uniref:hypothetical protein n=1 Tax=Marinoscillum sp. TaxID=2024838 RepID=UPI00330012C1
MLKAFNNWKVVLLSIIGATTFWFFNALNKDYDARISYPIEFQFDRDSVVIMQPLPTTLSIDVSSGGWNLLRKTFWFNVTPIQIVLENPTEIGFYTRNSLMPIVSDQLDELKINYLATDTIYINIERKRQKKVALFIDSLSIDLAENHRITSPITFVPDSVIVVGPQSFYDTLATSHQMRIESRGISSNFNREIDVKINGGRLTSSIPDQVRIQFQVDKFERRSIQIPIEKENFPEDSSVVLSTDFVQIFYTIQQSKEEDYSTRDFAVTADLSMLDRSDSTVLAILVYQPEEAMDIDVIPEHIKVTHARK